MYNKIIFGLLLSISSTAAYTSVIPEAWEDSKNAPTPVNENKYVFEVDGKAGLNYAMLIGDDLNLQIEGGYQAAAYPNSLTEKKTADSSSSTKTKNDYYNYGPYASLTLNFR